MKKKPTKKKNDDLFNQVVKLTGLPGKTIRRELKSILDKKNIDANQLTIDQLRAVVASYLREIMSNLLERASSRRQETRH